MKKILKHSENRKKKLIDELQKSELFFKKLLPLIKKNSSTSIDEFISLLKQSDIDKLQEIINDIIIKDSAYLDAIKIENYFSIKNIEITDLKDKKEIYLIGENGDGKTILLQAILLALKNEYSAFAQEYIKDIKDNINLSIKYDGVDKYIQNIEVKNIFAYGINRNKVHYNDFDRYGYGGLFDTTDSRRTTYLKDPFYELGKKYNGGNPIIEEFIQLLNSKILQENYQLFNGGDITFNELSEGYKSTVIWLYDLVSRLIENQKEIKKLADFKAIVLIDEIDLYLHPKWKYDFVYNLRKVFPNIQFIMITHSLVTILGASEDAVFYKVYKENGETKINKQIDDISYYTSDILMSSPLFNLEKITTRGYKDKLSSDDYVYHRIHKKIKERINQTPTATDKDVDSWLDDAFDEEFGE